MRIYTDMSISLFKHLVAVDTSYFTPKTVLHAEVAFSGKFTASEISFGWTIFLLVGQFFLFFFFANFKVN